MRLNAEVERSGLIRTCSHQPPVVVGERLVTVEALRGFAALAVAWFHFTNGANFPGPGLLQNSGSYGWLGVDIFFVLSGFILPFALDRARYSGVCDWPTFMLKRLLRLEPPYIVCVLLCLILLHISAWMPGFRGIPHELSFTQLALHVGYLIGLSDYGWLNPVFWTLAIEFQFYIVLGFAFPLLASKNSKVRLTSLTVLCVCSTLPLGAYWLIPHLGLFAVGIVVFWRQSGRAGSFETLLLLVASGALIVATTGYIVAGVALLTSLVLLHGQRLRLVTLSMVGTLSYSLYLVHVPIGGRVVNLAERWLTGQWGAFASALVAMGVSIAFAWVFWRYVEVPAKNWSSKVHY